MIYLRVAASGPQSEVASLMAEISGLKPQAAGLTAENFDSQLPTLWGAHTHESLLAREDSGHKDHVLYMTGVHPIWR